MGTDGKVRRRRTHGESNSRKMEDELLCSAKGGASGEGTQLDKVAQFGRKVLACLSSVCSFRSKLSSSLLRNGEPGEEKRETGGR